MKVGLIGTGKTGGEVLSFLQKDQMIQKIETFNSQNPPTPQTLSDLDAAVVFVPGDVFLKFLPLFLNLEQGPDRLVIGSTGLTFPSDLNQKLKDQKKTWVYSANFSLGMAILAPILRQLGMAAQFLPSSTLHIEETHHIHKKDAPSGTALLWQKWVGIGDLKITSHRSGDVKGIHKLILSTENEEIVLQHEAKSRRLFAEGAYWALKKITHPHYAQNAQNDQFGLIDFHELIKGETNERS